MKKECPDCNGKGKCYVSCCTGDIISSDFPMCPECHEHLGEDECELCHGTGEVDEQECGNTKVDLITQAEYLSDLKQDR